MNVVNTICLSLEGKSVEVLRSSGIYSESINYSRKKKWELWLELASPFWGYRTHAFIYPIPYDFVRSV